MELAKKPVRFLCKADANTFKISVPKTEHHYLFYRNQPYLVKFDLDIEFFREHEFFDEVSDDDTGQDSKSEPEEKEESDSCCVTEGCDYEVASVNSKHCPEHVSEEELEEMKKTDKPTYDKEELQKMRKTDLRELLEKLSPGKTCPVRKNNIVNLILEVQ